jgi:hypothetical protein
MSALSQLAAADVIDWQAVEAFATQHMILCLQADELFCPRRVCATSATIQTGLYVGYRPVLPFLLIVIVFVVSKNRVCCQCNQYRAQTAFPASNARPAILSDAQRNDLVDCIKSGYLEHNLGR